MEGEEVTNPIGSRDCKRGKFGCGRKSALNKNILSKAYKKSDCIRIYV